MTMKMTETFVKDVYMLLMHLEEQEQSPEVKELVVRIQAEIDGKIEARKRREAYAMGIEDRKKLLFAD
jgi:hypothetical protein